MGFSGRALPSGAASQQGLDPGNMLISQRVGPSWGQHIWSLEEQWLEIDWDKHTGVPRGQGGKAEEGASWLSCSWARQGRDSKEEVGSGGVLDGDSGGTGPLGLGKKGRTRKEEMHQAGGIFHGICSNKGQTPGSHRLTPSSAPTPSMSIFIHSFAQQLTMCDQPGIWSLNTEPVLNH